MGRGGGAERTVRWRHRWIALSFVVAASALLGLAAAPVYSATTIKTVVISATNSQFTDSGITLTSRASAAISVTGDGTCHAGGASDCPIGNPAGTGARCSASGPNRDVNSPPGPAGPDVPYDAVAGKIGENGKPFLIGAGKTVHGPGELFLVFNDCQVPVGYSDNAGSYTVKISYQSKPSLLIVCGTVPHFTDGCDQQANLPAPPVPVPDSVLDAAIIHLRYDGSNWNPQGPRISLLFGGKVVNTIAPTADFQHDVYALIWPHRTARSCSAVVGARQGQESITHTLEGHPIGRVVFVDNQRLLEFGDAICDGEETTFEHTPGTVVVLTGRGFDYFSGSGTRIRGVILPAPDQRRCFELFPRRRGVVVFTGLAGGRFTISARHHC